MHDVTTTRDEPERREVLVETGEVSLPGTLVLPPGAGGVVLFAHGSGSSRLSSRNRYVADVLHSARLATLLMDLLTPEEERVDAYTAELRFDIGLLARRLVGATDWLGARPQTASLPLGYFGASTGGGAALVAAAQRPGVVRAVVSRGGRPDLAGPALPRVQAPTLLIVGGLDYQVIALNHQAMGQMTAPVQLRVIPGATHLFEEPGALDQVAALARDWFSHYLSPSHQAPVSDLPDRPAPDYR